MNIVISKNVLASLDKYSKYLVKMGYKSKARAIEKKNLIIKSVYTNLGYVANGTTIGEQSKYKGLGSNEGCYIFVHEDNRSGSRWGFGYKVYKTRNCFNKNFLNLPMSKTNNIS